MKVRKASGGDVPRIAEIHVRSWQAAYRGILPDELLDDLKVSEREESWRALLSDGGDRWLTLVAAGTCQMMSGGSSSRTGSSEPPAYISPWRRCSSATNSTGDVSTGIPYLRDQSSSSIGTKVLVSARRR